MIRHRLSFETRLAEVSPPSQVWRTRLRIVSATSRLLGVLLCLLTVLSCLPGCCSDVGGVKVRIKMDGSVRVGETVLLRATVTTPADCENLHASLRVPGDATVTGPCFQLAPDVSGPAASYWKWSSDELIAKGEPVELEASITFSERGIKEVSVSSSGKMRFPRADATSDSDYYLSDDGGVASIIVEVRDENGVLGVSRDANGKLEMLREPSWPHGPTPSRRAGGARLPRQGYTQHTEARVSRKRAVVLVH
jgi:hypothetical protein